MAAVTLLGTQTFDTNSGTHTVTATPAVDDLIVIIAANTGNVLTTAPTDNQGGAYVQINTCVKASSADTMKAWVRTTKIASATSTIFSHAIGTSTGGGIAVMKITGVSRTGLAAIRQSAIQSNQAAAGTPTPVFAGAALTGNAIIGAVFNATSPATMTPRASPAYTERFDVGYATPTTGLEVMSIDSGETGTSIAWGGTSASAFCSLALEIDTSAATPIDDGEGWWSGAQRSFVGIAIAGAAAALSLSTAIQRDFIQNEEITQIPPPGPSAGAPPTQRLRHATVFQRWYAQDELPTAQASFTPTEEDSPALPAPVGSITSIIWATDEEIVPQPTFTPTEEYWQQSPLRQVAPFVQTWVDGDYSSFALAEDDGWRPSLPLASKAFVQSWTDDDLPIAPVAAVVSEDDWQAPTPAAPIAKVPSPWQADDEIERIGVEESYWFTLAVQLPAPNSQVWSESDAFASFALAEDDWSAPLVRSTPAFIPVWVDDDLPIAPAAIALDDEAWPAAQPARALPLSVAPWSDDDFVPSALVLDEDAWQAPNPGAIAARSFSPWQFDDQVVSVAPTLEEEQWLQLYSIRPDPVVRLWFDQDEVPAPATPLTVGEDYWLTFPTPARPFVMAFPVDEDAPTLHDDCCTSAAQIWAFVLPNGMSAADTLVELLELVRELHQIQGLEAGSPLVVETVQRTAAAIVQSVSDIAGTVTVTRL